MRTQHVTTAALAEHLGRPPAYGETAAAVLETCALIAKAEEQWDPKQVIHFQQKVGMHEKVWGRLLAIHRCNRWQEVDQVDLPGNYTALYALTTLSDEAWSTLLKGNMLKSQLTSRQIHQWALVAPSIAKVYERRSRSKQTKNAEESDALQQVRLVLTFPRQRSSVLKDVLTQLQNLAQDHGMDLASLVTSTRGFGPMGTPEQAMEEIAKDLHPLLKELVQDAGKVLKDSLGIQTEEDLINASMRDFLKFINRTAGSSAAALETYGKQYCLKLVLEYNRLSNTRANRFNYKKKLEELAEHRENQELKDAARLIYRDFIGEVPGEK